jgi:hypothetical protein
MAISVVWKCYKIDMCVTIYLRAILQQVESWLRYAILTFPKRIVYLVSFFANLRVCLLLTATPHPHAFLFSLPPLVQYGAFYDPLLVISALMHA